jgi:RNA recognition motif-containing protein
MGAAGTVRPEFFCASFSTISGQFELVIAESLQGSQGMTMGKNLYVGNLSFKATADDLRELFSSHGTVTSAQVIMDRETGKPRGFGFVEMADGSQAAIDALNGQEFQGRPLTVNEARPREERRGGGGGGGGRSGGYGDRY